MTTMAQEMKNRLQDIERRAKAVGSNVTQICKNTGITRTTFERWRDSPLPPQTIKKIDELEAEVLKQERLYVAPVAPRGA